mgnify:CR=1 FL=1
MKPILGITMGDPSGNGPEISVKALMKPETYEVCRPLIVGDAKCMEAAIPTVKGAESMKINVIHDVKEAKFEPGIIDVYDLDVVDLSKRLYKKDRKKLAEIPEVEGVDGMGLMLGVRLKTKKAADILSAAAENGLLILTAKEKLRTYEEIDKGMEILKKLLA